MINRELMSEMERELFDAAQRDPDPFSFQAAQFDAKWLMDEVKSVAPGVKWYKGRIKAGHGSIEDADCYVAWHNHCPLIVPVDASAHRKHNEPGTPVFKHSFRFIVSGHMSGSSDTFAGALQSAIIRACKASRAESDSEWLKRGSGGKGGFFRFHEVDPVKDASVSITELMTEENMRPVPVTEGPYTVEGGGDSPSGPRL